MFQNVTNAWYYEHVNIGNQIPHVSKYFTISLGIFNEEVGITSHERQEETALDTVSTTSSKILEVLTMA